MRLSEDRARDGLSERILILDGHQPQLALDGLTSEGLDGVVCEDIDELCAQISEGLGAALLADDFLAEDGVAKLTAALRHQPRWSAYPLILLGDREDRRIPNREIAFLASLSFLDRPLHVRSMAASVHAALGIRRRQYEARRALESRDAFLATLGHELRNPLGAISLAIHGLSTKMPEAAASREYRILNRQLQNATGLVDDLLDIARATHGKVSLKRQRFDLGELVRAAFETFETKAIEHGLAWKIELQGGSPWVDADRQRLEQVFANLLTNAIKYTPAGGCVTVRVRREGRAAVVAVTDTGVGLSPEMCTRVFELFTQVERSKNRAAGGLGLGLALVRSIIQLHGGTVHAESAGLGCGSSFIVELPCLGTAEVWQEDSASEPRHATPRSVLVIEDNGDICDLLAELLRASGHAVTCAREGPAGLEALVAVAPDIAFIDIGLPGLDGLEVARRARNLGSTSWLVALTGYGELEDKARAIAAGFDDHLVKPVTNTSFERALQRAPLDNNRGSGDR